MIGPTYSQPRKFVREVGFRGENLLHYNAIQCSGGVYIRRGFRKRIRAFSFLSFNVKGKGDLQTAA
jgi:hypothetical protein